MAIRKFILNQKLPGCVNTLHSQLLRRGSYSETLCFDYLRMHSTEVRVMRIFNTYGPRMLEDDGRVVSNFITQALRDQPLTIYGDGSQTRSFCYVDDLIEGMIKLMNSDLTGPVNIGNPDEFTILELAERVRNSINPELPVINKPLPADDPRKRKPDISLAERSLDWRPSISLEKGLESTIEWFRSNFEQKERLQ